MILSDIETAIRQAVQDDPMIESLGLTRKLNTVIRLLCKDFCIPELVASDTIDIPAETQGEISLPDDYQHNLFRCINITTGDLVNIRTGNKYLIEKFGSTKSDDRHFTTDVAVHGTTLYFRPVSQYDQQLELWYYRLPIEITDSTLSSTEPDGIPTDLHNQLIVGGVLKDIFALIEDGFDGQKVNTAYWTQEYMTGRQELEKHCKGAPKQTPVIRRTARFF